MRATVQGRKIPTGSSPACVVAGCWPALIRCFCACSDDGLAPQINHAGLRRIAQTGIRATLVADFDLASGRCRDFHFQPLAIDRLFTEKLIAVGFTFRECWLLFCGESIEFQAFLIQVITVSDLPEQLGFTGFQAFGRQHECLVDQKTPVLSRMDCSRPGPGWKSAVQTKEKNDAWRSLVPVQVG